MVAPRLALLSFALLVATAWIAPGAAARGADAPEATTATAGAEAPGGAALAEQAGAVGAAPEPITRNALVQALADAADWFFAREEGEQAHERTWGVVPLVVADSTAAGYGGGLKFVEQDVLGFYGGEYGVRGVKLDLLATFTSQEFFEAETHLGGPKVANALDWRFDASYASMPRLYYFGIGNQASREERGSLWLEATEVELQLGALVNQYQFVTISRFVNVNARDGREMEGDDDVPPVSEQFSGSELVGFGSAGYTNGVGALAAIDYRDYRADPSFGARFEVGGLYHGKEIGDSPFQFGLYWADATGYLPLVRRNLVLALHGRLESTDASRRAIPFYALPQLGGSRNLRGYLDGRVRDRHSILLQAELRFPIWKVLSGAVFVDTGRVYEDITDPPFLDHYLVDGGVGLRFILHPDIVVRLDLAFSNEDVTFALAFGHAF